VAQVHFVRFPRKALMPSELRSGPSEGPGRRPPSATTSGFTNPLEAPITGPNLRPDGTARLQREPGDTLAFLLGRIEAADAGPEQGKSRRMMHELLRLAGPNPAAWPQEGDPAPQFLARVRSGAALPAPPPADSLEAADAKAARKAAERVVEAEELACRGNLGKATRLVDGTPGMAAGDNRPELRPRWCRRWRSRWAVGRMRACWAVPCEEAPGRDFSRSGLWFFPFGVFACLSRLVWLCDTRSARGYSIHPLSLGKKEGDLAAVAPAAPKADLATVTTSNQCGDPEWSIERRSWPARAQVCADGHSDGRANPVPHRPVRLPDAARHTGAAATCPRARPAPVPFHPVITRDAGTSP
jgi:hypothetical protein